MGHFLDNGNYEPNTVDSIRRVCTEPDWDGYDAKPIPEAVLKNAEFIATADILPKGFEMFPFPCGRRQALFERAEGLAAESDTAD